MSNLINIAEAITAEAHKLFAAETKIIDSFLAHGHTVEVIGTSGNRMRLGTGVAVTARVTTTIDGEKIYLRGEVLCSPIQDWPTFWQSLTPAECADALRAAPRVAGEWVEYADGYARDPIIGGDGLPIADVTHDGHWTVYGDQPGNGHGESSRECRDAADAALIAQGWVLL